MCRVQSVVAWLRSAGGNMPPSHKRCQKVQLLHQHTAQHSTAQHSTALDGTTLHHGTPHYTTTHRTTAQHTTAQHTSRVLHNADNTYPRSRPCWSRQPPPLEKQLYLDRQCRALHLWPDSIVGGPQCISSCTKHLQAHIHTYSIVTCMHSG